MVRAGVISFFQVDGTVSDVLNSRCYDGIDSFFDKDLYTCETDETDKLLEDLGPRFLAIRSIYLIGNGCVTL